MFARCIEHFGGRSASEALAAALEFDEFEPAGAQNRGLVFHEKAWHWAMPTDRGRGLLAVEAGPCDPVHCVPHRE
jgi:hypothetical protein